MTRKLAIGYSLLFIFVFAFGLSFSLAGSSRAEIRCCIVWCDAQHEQKSYDGHEVEYPEGTECVCDGTDPCDHAYLCDLP